MNTPKAILIGLALVAAAVYFSRDVPPAQAELGGPNFQFFGLPGPTYFKLNVDTGKVAYCVLEHGVGSDTTDLVRNAKTTCSKFQ